MMICAGANEPEGWIDQSLRYKRFCEAKGIYTKSQLVDDAHHFSLLDFATDRTHPLFKQIIRFIKS